MSSRRPTGFAGLPSLVTDVEAIIGDAQRQGQERRTQPEGSAASSPERQAAKAGPPTPAPAHKRAEPTSSARRIRWGRVLAVAAVILVLWAMISKSDDASAPPEPATAASQPSPPDIGSAVPDLSPSTGDMVSREQEPQIGGAERVLTPSEIRYCLSEDIRLEGAKSAVNRYSDVDIQRFNTYIDDYNQRCGRYKYQQGTLEEARAEVEAHRSDLLEQGRQRFSETAPTSSDARNPTGAPPTSARSRRSRPARQSVGEFRGQNGLEVSVTPTQGGSNASGALNGRNPGRATENLATCLSGETPALCDHSALSADEAEAVARAERSANLRTCESGEYPILCRHDLLTSEQAASVQRAERRANYETCSSGQYPVLCRHDLLTAEQEVVVRAAERSANYRTCISGLYAALCNHALLSPEEARQVRDAERRARYP